MSKLKNKLVIAVMAMFGITTFMNCNKHEEISNKTKTTIKVSDFRKSGEIHNAFLTNVKDNFETVKGVKDENEKIEIISNFNKEFVSKLDISAKEKQELIQGLDAHKNFVVTSNLVFKSFGQEGNKSEGKGNLFDMIKQFKEDKLIDENAYTILNKLSSDLKLNYELSLSDAEFKQSIQVLISDFNEFGYGVSSGEGKMVATVLAISIASIEWWEENPDAFANETKRKKAVPVWVGADVAGAVYGAATGAISSYAGTGEVNWTAVGVGSLSGAIAGSTGIIGKAGKWLASLF